MPCPGGGGKVRGECRENRDGLRQVAVDRDDADACRELGVGVSAVQMGQHE